MTQLVPQSAFENFLEKSVNISPVKISEGSKSHSYIRQLLASKSENEVWFPRLVEGDFLSGSYARGTKIHPLDDIDVMIVIDGTGFYPIRNGLVWNAQVRGSGQNDNPLLKQVGTNGLLSSRRILELFEMALKQSHPSSRVSKDGQAINVWLESKDLGIDVVPCFHIIPYDGSQDVYYIPIGYGTDAWKMTNPKIDELISETLHKHHNEKLKPIIKILKLWNKVYNGDRLRSYHLETVAWYVFSAYPGKIQDYGVAMIYFFNNAHKYFASYCSDATGLGGYIDSYLKYTDRLLTLQKIRETQRILANSLMQGLANQSRQLSGWRQIFGDEFGT